MKVPLRGRGRSGPVRSDLVALADERQTLESLGGIHLPDLNPGSRSTRRDVDVDEGLSEVRPEKKDSEDPGIPDPTLLVEAPSESDRSTSPSPERRTRRRRELREHVLDPELVRRWDRIAFTETSGTSAESREDRLRLQLSESGKKTLEGTEREADRADRPSPLSREVRRGERGRREVIRKELLKGRILRGFVCDEDPVRDSGRDEVPVSPSNATDRPRCRRVVRQVSRVEGPPLVHRTEHSGRSPLELQRPELPVHIDQELEGSPETVLERDDRTREDRSAVQVDDPEDRLEDPGDRVRLFVDPDLKVIVVGPVAKEDVEPWSSVEGNRRSSGDVSEVEGPLEASRSRQSQKAVRVVPDGPARRHLENAVIREVLDDRL